MEQGKACDRSGVITCELAQQAAQHQTRRLAELGSLGRGTAQDQVPQVLLLRAIGMAEMLDKRMGAEARAFCRGNARKRETFWQMQVAREGLGAGRAACEQDQAEIARFWQA